MNTGNKNIFSRIKGRTGELPAEMKAVNSSLMILVFIQLFFFNCQTTGNNQTATITDGTFQYDLTKPDESWYLPADLNEISALSYTPDGWLASIQDEKGILFLLKFETREIKKIHFAKHGDYEGVEILGDTAYVLKSNGDLYIFNYKDKDPHVNKVSTPLTKDNNTESLAYDPVTKLMLIGCKGKAALKSNHAKGKAVYAFNLSKRTLSAEPVILLHDKELKEVMYSQHLSPYKKNAFRLSGLAVHPVTKNFYLIGTVGKLMIILDRDHKIKSIAPLSPHLYVQPEGICFDPDGTMYISSEGKIGKGFILKFEPTRINR